MPSVYEVIKTIHQAAADAKDHPYGGKDTGALEREKGHLINDSRVVDGFSVKIGGNVLTICYETEAKLKQTHENNFVENLERTVNDLATYLKKEYKSSLKEALNLKEIGELEVFMENISRVRIMVRASKSYEIGNLPKEDDPRKDRKKAFDKIDTIVNEKYSFEAAWKNYVDEQK
jgi:hypothetical protein